MKLFVLVLLAGLPSAVLAQSYEEIRVAYPGAIETTVTSEYTFVYKTPQATERIQGEATSNLAGRYTRGKEVLAYRHEGDFYAVATPEQGHVGYILLTALDVPQVEGAAAAPELVRDYRSPQAARIMSLFLPGSGHLYAGETTTGAALAGLGVASLVGGYVYSTRTKEFVCADEENAANCGYETDHSALVAGAAIYAGLAAYSFLTAGRAATRHNERMVLTASAGVVPFVASGSVRPGLAMRVRW